MDAVATIPFLRVPLGWAVLLVPVVASFFFIALSMSEEETMTIDFYLLLSILAFVMSVEMVMLVVGVSRFSVVEGLVLLLEIATLAILLRGDPAPMAVALTIVISFRSAHILSSLLARRIRRVLARRTGQLFLCGLLDDRPVTLRSWLAADWALRMKGESRD